MMNLLSELQIPVTKIYQNFKCGTIDFLVYLESDYMIIIFCFKDLHIFLQWSIVEHVKGLSKRATGLFVHCSAVQKAYL